MSQVTCHNLLAQHGVDSCTLRKLAATPGIDWTKLLDLVKTYGPIVAKVLEVVLPLALASPTPAADPPPVND